MPHARVLIALAAALVATGCGDLLSLHALFTPQNQVFDPAIEGRWQNPDDVLQVERSGDRYDVVLQSKKDASEKVKYEVHLVDINGVRFADLLPEDQIGHMFLRVHVAGEQLHLAFLDSEWLRKRVPHEEADTNRIGKQAVLTASTPQVRAMVAKYSREPKAYDEHEVVFDRAK
jgi:hypothetical protein